MASGRNNATRNAFEDDTIPESILSFSKDARYVRQCQELLQNALEALLERKESLFASGTGGRERHHELQQMRKQLAWLISCILYFMASIRSGRTLGMEALALTFSDDKNSPVGKSELVARFGRSLFPGLLIMLTATGGLAWDYFKIATPNNVSSNNHGRDSQQQQQYQERLRGRERLLVHERLRQQMLQRVADANETSTSPTREQQRQEQSGTAQTDANTSRNSAANLNLSTRVLSVCREVSKFVFRVCSHLDGPHDNVDTSDNNDERNENDRTSIAYSVARWIVRLHLAHFLWTGKYPTLVHRCLGLGHKHEQRMVGGATTSTASVTPIVSRPNTNRVIALAIILQASTSLAGATFHRFARTVANYLEARALARAERGDRAERARARDAEVRTKLGVLFGIGSNSPPAPTKGSKLRIAEGGGTRYPPRVKPVVVCTICRTDRKHPAAPTACGHVFCWSCLAQWVSTVRPECPLCRAPCSAKDIIALHNYAPAPKQDQQ